MFLVVFVVLRSVHASITAATYPTSNENQSWSLSVFPGKTVPAEYGQKVRRKIGGK